MAVGVTSTAAFALLAGTATAGIVSSLGVAQRTVAGKPAKIVVDRRGDSIYELGGESLEFRCVHPGSLPRCARYGSMRTAAPTCSSSKRCPIPLRQREKCSCGSAHPR